MESTPSRRRPARRQAIAVLVASLLMTTVTACEHTTTTPSTSVSNTPTTAPQISLTPVALTSGSVTLLLSPTAEFAAAGGSLTARTDKDGSAHLLVELPSVTSLVARDPIATVAVTAPEETTMQIFTDGSLVVVGADGALQAGASVTGGDVEDEAGTATLTGHQGTDLWLADRAVTALVWGDREGGRSLAVNPTAWARTSSLAAEAAVWAAVSAEPGADTTSMRAQLDCHLLGAPDKGTWNLEPWRPDVDSVTMLSSRCNPT